MRNLTAFALRSQATIMVLVTLVSIYGVVSYATLPKQLDPGFTIRAAVVTTRLPGASAEKIEQLVTDKIERAVQEMPELDNVSSESQPGLSFVTANFQERYKNMRPIFDKLRRKVNDIGDELPEGIRGPQINDEYGDVFGSVYALTGEGFSYAELEDIADEIKDRLLKVDQIAKVEIQGTQEETVFVEYNTARLRELGLSPQQLSQILSAANIIRGGGDIRTGRERVRLEPTGNFETVADIRKTVIQLPGGAGIVYLEDIADIYRDYVDPPSSFARSDGNVAIILAVSLREGGNILELGETLARVIPDIEADYPHGIALTPVFLQSRFVDNAVNRFAVNLLQAVAIVVAVMLLFLGLRTGLIVATLVPVTIFFTLSAMQVFDITVNQISLAALIISLGLLVDNAIVITETILARRESGQPAFDAAVEAGREMAVPLLTSSLTTAAAFLPIFLAESAVGEYTADIFKVVTIALLSSWLLAMAFIPLMALIFMRVKKDKQSAGDGPMYRIYSKLLSTALHNRLLFLVLIAGVFYSALWAIQFVPSVFIPPRTDPVITGKFNMPRGTAIEQTEQIARDLEQYMATQYRVDDEQISAGQRGIVSWAAWIGQSAPRYTLALDPGSADPSAFNMLVNTTDHLIIPDIARTVQDYARQHYPDLEVQLKKLENGQPIPYPVVVRVSGPDIERLYELAAPIKDKLWSMGGILSVNDDWGPRTKKLLVEVDQERALRAGVSSDDVAVSLEAGLSGIDLTQFREGDQLIPVTMRSVAGDRQDIGKLEGMTVYSQNSSTTVPLRQVADIRLEWQPGIIKRRDRDRTIAIQAQLLPNVTATDVNSEFLPWLEEQSRAWPRRYYYEIGGESETSGDANEAIVLKLPIAGMLILLLLVAQFNSVRKPLVILATIPLGLIGVVYGLLIADSIFGFFTILGLISLSGIVINNAIVLIDRFNIEVETNGLAPAQAIMTACRQRLRPILLTTATTVGGMLPLWLSHDPMFETMAVAIIFGLLFATLLTLLVVPVLYSILFRVDLSEIATR